MSERKVMQDELWAQYLQEYPHLKELNDRNTPERQEDFTNWLRKPRKVLNQEGFNNDGHEACELLFEYQKYTVRGYWCEAHQTWVYEQALSITYNWADGTITEIKIGR